MPLVDRLLCVHTLLSVRRDLDVDGAGLKGKGFSERRGY